MFNNIIWDLVGKFGSQIVSFGISIFLTRLLQPEEFGIMAMAMVLITFAHIFLDFGFYRAIIQRQDVTQEQYSTVFFLNAGVAFFLTLLCFFLASPISSFYQQPLIKPVFRTLSITFFLYGLNLVPAALLYKRLQFKINSILTLIASVMSGVVGVVMAYQGFGVWSLIGQTLISSFLILVLNFVFAKWWPSPVFSIPSIKPLWSYGSKMFLSGALDTLYTRLDTFIIGKIFSTQTLGYYARAQSMDSIVRQFSANAIVSSLFPYIAKHQHDRDYLKQLYTKYLHIICFVSIFLSGILFLIAKQLFDVLFTPRWGFSAELFQLMSITAFAWPVSSLMCNIIAGTGNSKAFLRLEIYKKIAVLPVYLFGFLLGLKGFLICMAVMGFVGVALNGIFAGKEVSMDLQSQFKIVLNYFFLGVVAAAFTYFGYQSLPELSVIPSIFALAGGFCLLYILGAYLIKLEGVNIINLSFEKLKVVFND